MSSSLRWKPVVEPSGTFSTAVKFALRKRHSEGVTENTELSDKDIPYLEGLRDAGVEGADAVIAAIEEHGAILVWEEF